MKINVSFWSPLEMTRISSILKPAFPAGNNGLQLNMPQSHWAVSGLYPSGSFICLVFLLLCKGIWVSEPWSAVISATCLLIKGFLSLLPLCLADTVLYQAPSVAYWAVQELPTEFRILSLLSHSGFTFPTTFNVHSTQQYYLHLSCCVLHPQCIGYLCQ